MNKLIALAGVLACVASSASATDLQTAQAAAMGLQQSGFGHTFGKKLGLRLHHHGAGTERDAGDSLDARGRRKFDSFSLLGDWHPRATGLRLTAGVVANRSGLDAGAASLVSPAVGSARSHQASPALQAGARTGHVDPYLGLGWSKLPSRGKGLGFYADAGVLFQHPRTGLVHTGMSATDLAAEPSDAHRSADGRHRYSPVLSVGLTYGF